MALTITKQTNGYFVFQSGEAEKRGSNRPYGEQRGDYLSFYNHKGEFIEAKVKYDQITTVDGVTTKDDYASAEEVMDNLFALGMFQTSVIIP